MGLIGLIILFPFYRSNTQESSKLKVVFTNTQLKNLLARIHTQTFMVALGVS